jgi:hypothetical protein
MGPVVGLLIGCMSLVIRCMSLDYALNVPENCVPSESETELINAFTINFPG